MRKYFLSIHKYLLQKESQIVNKTNNMDVTVNWVTY